MAAWRENFDNLNQEQRDLIAHFAPQYRQIVAWRYNFTSTTFSRRFEQTQERLIDLAARAVLQDQENFRVRMRADILALRDHWSETHPFYKVSSGSASA